MTRWLALVLASPLLASEPVAARFQESDADALDDEDRYGSETYNDKISYRYPLSWDRLWDSRDVGFRVSAGSLDIRRFDFSRDLKLVAAPDGPLSLGFAESRRDDTLEKRADSRYFVDGRVVGPWRVRMMADGGTPKEYGDVGWAAGYRADRDHFVRGEFWSVDHYYATKKVEPGDHRTGKPDQARFVGRWKFGRARVDADLSAEHSFRWSRPSRDEEYEYERREASWRLETPIAAATSLILQGQHDYKWEALRREGERDTMRRHASLLDAGAVREFAADDYATAGSAMISRHVRYGDELVTRQEAAPYVTWHFPLAAPAHYTQLGAFASRVHRTEDGADLWGTETKVQAAWDYRLTETARLLLNTTWDTDMVRAGRPWGGGAIQMLAVF